MWSRVVEVMLGIWLMISPFIFAHPPSEVHWWTNDIAAGFAVATFGVLSFWHPTRWAHILTLLVGCWLIGFAYYHGFGEPPPASQNHLTLGLLLLMFGILPNEATRPPRSWEEKRLASSSEDRS